MRNDAEARLEGGAGKCSGRKAATSRAPRVLLKLALLSISAVLVWSFSCEDPFETNPDLVLLLAKEGHYPSRPVPSPDGKSVYYLDDTCYAGGTRPGGKGDLHVWCIEDSSDRLLLSGEYLGLAVSQDGQKLGLSYGKANCSTSLFILLDTTRSEVESLYVVHAETECVPLHLAFSSNRDELIFNIWPKTADDSTYFYSIDLEHDSSARLILKIPWHQRSFDLFARDSIYADSLARGYQPSVNPRYPRWVVFARKEVTWLSYRWMLHDRQNGTVESYGSGTRPLGKGFIGWPSWTPDGNGLLFVAGRRTGPSGQPYAQLELWLLKNAAEYLPDSR